MKENKNFAFLFNNWATKEPIKIFLKDSSPLVGIIIAFGKSGFINHFDIITILITSTNDGKVSEVINIKLEDIIRIGTPNAAF